MESTRSRAGRPTTAEAAELTDRIRRAAVDTFLRQGYDGTTMEAVAQAAGVTKGTLYTRYADKRALFLAVSSWALTRQEPAEREPGPLPDDLAGALTQIARAILARSVDPDLVRLNRMAIAESARFPEFAASSRAVTWTPRIQVIIDLLRRHERAGTVVLADAEIAAEQFFAMVGAMPALLAAYGVHRPAEAEEEHLRHAVRLFLSGVLARETTAAETGPPAGHRQLGRGGPHVFPIALRPVGVDQRTMTGLLRRYLDAGGNLVDVSGVGDAAEEICGRALRRHRSSVVLAAAPAGGVPRHLRAACDASLRRLRTDHLDLYQVADDPAVPLEETVDALDDLVRAGKVRQVGAVGLPAYRLMKALSLSDRRARARFIALRDEYHPARRTVEREHFPLLREEGLGFLSPGPGPAATGRTRVAEAVRSASARLGCTAAQLILAWQRTRPVTSTIVDAPHLEDALAALRVEIPADVAAELDEAGRS